MFFQDLQSNYGDRPILVDNDGKSLFYRDFVPLEQRCTRWILPRDLVFLLVENDIISVSTYLACLRNQAVPLLLPSTLNEDMLHQLIAIYEPNMIVTSLKEMDLTDYVKQDEMEGYGFWEREVRVSHHMYPELAVLLTTSGSTGSPKLVRQSYRNIHSNAISIADYLKLSSQERPITTLPMHYTYGLSIIHSHLAVGASIYLTKKSVVDKEFWDFLQDRKITSIAGVPYTYTILDKLRFFKKDLPFLKTMTQAGGKLSEELHKKYAEYAKSTGKDFVVMYGQTEATARMAYLPADKALEKIGCMGIAIPGGRFELIDIHANLVTQSHEVGELVYYGENVTLGYAQCKEDLTKGDERRGRLETGDMATRDEDGFYRIVGRKKRFLKIFGNRVNLDEVERKCNGHFQDVEFACVGTDDNLKVFYRGNIEEERIIDYLQELTGFHRSAFRALPIEEIPKNEAGKVIYSRLEEKV